MKLLAQSSCAIVLATSQLLAQTAETPRARPTSPVAVHSQAADQKPKTMEDGQQVFQRNCARCHNAPDAFPLSISGTVALHMRIRANLSERQYKALLAFLNP